MGGTRRGTRSRVPISDTIGSIDFDYFDGSSYYTSGSGTNGDLIRVKVTTKDSGGEDVTRHTLFRYYTGSWSTSNRGIDHRVKYIVGPQSYKELEEYSTASDPRSATDADVAAYADYTIEYESAGKVSKVERSAAGCGCGGGGEGAYEFSYSANGSWSESSSEDTWRMSVTVDRPDGTTRIVDVDGAGNIRNSVLDAPAQTTSQRWIENFEFDNGRLVEHYSPSACDKYVPSTHSVDRHSQTGLVRGFTYDSDGNLTDRWIKQGASGAQKWLEKREYTSQPFGDGELFVTTKVRRYHKETDSTQVNTASHYDETEIVTTFHADANDVDGDANVTETSLAIEEITVKLPVVPTTQNGPGGTAKEVRTYKVLPDLVATTPDPTPIVWTKDTEGHVGCTTGDDVFGTTTLSEVDMTATTPYQSSGSPLEIDTTTTLDVYGRVTKTTSPEGIETKVYHTHLSGGELVTLSARVKGTTAGPISITVRDHDGKVVTTAAGVPTSTPTDLSDDIDDLEPALEDAFDGTLYSRVGHVYDQGSKTATHVWTDATDDTASTHHITSFEYDSMGRVERVEDPEGTITLTTYTYQGRIATRSIGTDDSGGQSDNMTQVTAWYYDGEENSSSATGDGNLTLIEQYTDADANPPEFRETVYKYDWRNRQDTIDGEELSYEILTFDNLDRPTSHTLHESSSAPSDDSTRRAYSSTEYDSQGRVFRTTVREVVQAGEDSGDLGATLETNRWYDAGGALIKTESPSGLFEKRQYDRVGRVTATYVSYDTDSEGYDDADDVTGDIVVSKSEKQYDKDGRVSLGSTWERKHDSSADGDLTTSNAEYFQVATWYDDLGRRKDVANYGTEDPSPLSSRPGTVPGRSDTVLVTSYTYDSAGRLEETTDPEGRDEHRDYNNQGQLTAVFSNYLNGTQGESADEDDDRKQSFEYDGNGRVVERSTWMTGTSDIQTTEYVYGVTKGATAGDSQIASNNLLQMVKYPDPTTGSPSTASADQESFAYNAQGQLVWREDQNGTIHEYVYDELGRQTDDKVTTVATGIDTSVLRIQTSYDVHGRISKRTSHSAATGGSVVNEVELVYNDLGQVKEDRQEHEGAVDGSTLAVTYDYSELENNDPLSRLESITYPGSGRVVYYHYDDSAGTEYGKLDWVLGRVSGISNSATATDDRIADYAYQGMSRVVTRTGEEPASDLTMTYGFDRFGRVESLLASANGTLNDWDYGYGRNSSVLWREENQFSTKDDLYTYDRLDRLDEFKRGDLNGTRDGLTGSAARSKDFGLDLLGNWKSVDTDGAGAISRAHNRSNEITDADTSFTGEDPVYDDNGNTTEIHRPAPQKRVFEYDAWNRVTTVRISSGGTIVASYEYDGLNRRIEDNTSGVDYYYTIGWQLISERAGAPPDDKTQIEYVWGVRYVDEILSRSEDKSDPADGDTQDAGDETLWYVQNANNWSVETLVDDNGDAVERYLYDPYGLSSEYNASFGTQTATYDNRVRFTGRLWNAAAYSYSYRMREFSPRLGRFLQRDPAGYIDGPNLYDYTLGRPITLVDPLGLSGVIPLPDDPEFPGAPIGSESCGLYPQDLTITSCTDQETGDEKKSFGDIRFSAFARGLLSWLSVPSPTRCVDSPADVTAILDEIHFPKCVRRLTFVEHGGPGMQILGDGAITADNAADIFATLRPCPEICGGCTIVFGGCHVAEQSQSDMQDIADATGCTVQARSQCGGFMMIGLSLGDMEQFEPGGDAEDRLTDCSLGGDCDYVEWQH